MAIALTSNDISTRGINNTNLAQFAGRARQVVINVDDGYRPVVMDGSTVGGKFKCASVAEVDSVESSLNTKINSANSKITNLTSKITNIETAVGGSGNLDDVMTETQADAKYLAKSANAVSASKLATARTIGATGDAAWSVSFDGSANRSAALTLANSGVTAGSYGPSANATPNAGATFQVPQITVDAKGRVTSAVTRTVKIPNAPTTVSGNAATATKLATARTIAIGGVVTGTATSFDGSANITINTTKATDSTKVPISGSRGALAGYSTISSGAASTITASSADDMTVTSGSTIAVNNGSSGQTWCKVRYITGGVTSVSLGSNWDWVGGEAPSIDKPGILICYWAGTGGVANFVSGVK